MKKTSCDSNKFEDMFDKQGYINSQSNSEKDFYDKIISSQMFLDLIIKRSIPRDTKEKIQALFFEEKLNVKIAQKKFIRGNKILEQNVLLPSKQYDYGKDSEIIDLTGNNSYTILDKETINFFDKENTWNSYTTLLPATVCRSSMFCVMTLLRRPSFSHLAKTR